MQVTMDFARRDDCLVKMVPSDLRLLVSERDQLQQQLTEAQARVARLEEAIGPLLTYVHTGIEPDGGEIDFATGVEEESPRQSLTAIRREAMEEVLEKAKAYLDNTCADTCRDYLDRMPLPIDEEGE